MTTIRSRSAIAGPARHRSPPARQAPLQLPPLLAKRGPDAPPSGDDLQGMAQRHLAWREEIGAPMGEPTRTLADPPAPPKETVPDVITDEWALHILRGEFTEEEVQNPGFLRVLICNVARDRGSEASRHKASSDYYRDLLQTVWPLAAREAVRAATPAPAPEARPVHFSRKAGR